jgi:hypothetical protein
MSCTLPPRTSYSLPPERPPTRRRGISAALIFAYLRHWIWTVFKIVVFGMLYIYLISEGLRLVIPALGQKLWKLPGLSILRNYEETHRLDLAPVFAIVLLIAVFYLWCRVLEGWIFPDHDLQTLGRHPGRYRLFIITLGSVVLGADLVLFYVSMTSMGWKGVVFSLPALLATAAYAACVIFVSFVSVALHKTIIDLKKE